MEYDSGEREWVPMVSAVVVALGLVGGGAWWFMKKPAMTLPSSQSVVRGAQEAKEANTHLGSLGDPTSGETSAEVLNQLGVRAEALDPADVARMIAEALEEGKFDRAAKAMGEAAIAGPELKRLLGGAGAKLKGIREVGELEANRRKRYAVEFEDGRASLVLDLTKQPNGRWAVEQARMQGAKLDSFPAAEIASSDSVAPKAARSATRGPDALDVSDKFLQAALSQKFQEAKEYVDTSKMSDAKIAAMCILFEEGQYQLDPVKPLKVMFNRGTAAGYLANVLTGEQEKPAQFSLSLARPSEDLPWQVTEINLDALLADYAERVAGGDVYYTPLVAKPEGGDKLVLFFGFDEVSLVPRTERQLKIVADILKTDPNRKLTISGHADAMGSDDYNESLSAKRAESVRKYLVISGVRADQIRTIAAGEGEPMRPNETDSGEDNPDGRRANRRTEIYLDF